MWEPNFQAADAYQARICEAEHARRRAFRAFPPTCDACHNGNVTPDGTWAWCEAREEWVRNRLTCIDSDEFEPTAKWEGYRW